MLHGMLLPYCLVRRGLFREVFKCSPREEGSLEEFAELDDAASSKGGGVQPRCVACGADDGGEKDL
eukprot:scaffold151814_cov17-Tisochrysis_lutea.AAC.1